MLQSYDVVWAGQPPWEATQLEHQLLDAVAAKARFLPGMDGPLELRLLDSLADGNMVDGEVITANVCVLNARRSHFGADSMPSVLCLPTYFMNRLLRPDGSLSYANAAPYTRPQQSSAFASVLECSYLVAPCHIPGATLEEGHWVLVLADLDNCRIITVDPIMVRPTHSQAKTSCMLHSA